MQRIFLSYVDGEYIFSTPDGLDDRLADALEKSVGQFSKRANTRLGFVEDYLNYELVKGEDWKDAILADHEDIRERIKRFVKDDFNLEIGTEPNTGWNTRRVSRKNGAVDHYMQIFTSLRPFFQELIDSGIRPKRTQNPLDKNLWHEETDEGKWLYCVRRYGNKAAQVFPYAGAYYLPAERRPYPRSLFNPVGIGARMAAAIRERSGDHVATNIVEIICCGDPVRYDDLTPASAADWEDCGDTILSRNKGDGDDHNKPTLMNAETHANLCRRIDLDHAADPENRPSVEMLKEWWANGEMEKLAAFKLFQLHPSKGHRVPAYNSVWQLLNKACKKHGVTVGRGAAEQIASLRWARREKVDGRMLEIHRSAKTVAELKKGMNDLQQEMFWRTDQSGNYGSHAANQVATERKREAIRIDKERQAALARGEKVHARPQLSIAVREANSVAMQRPPR